jgi:hypothetical protein
MTSIVNDMLFLSHAHAGEHASQLTQVSLREETLKTAEYVEPLLLKNSSLWMFRATSPRTSTDDCSTAHWPIYWKIAQDIRPPTARLRCG